MSHLPPAAVRILHALCLYHYLTKPQMVALGLAKSIGSLDNHAMPYLAPRRDKQTGAELIPKGQKKSAFLCHSLTYGLRDEDDKPGKNHFMYYLTQTGLDRAYWEFEAELQSGNGELREADLWRPAEHERLSNDYHHRRHYVSAHMAIRQWAEKTGARIDFWQHYYQSDPNRPKLHGRPPSRNRVPWDEEGRKFCTPDGLLGITHQGRSRIYVLELHQRTPTKLVVDQLYRNFRAARAIRAMFPKYPTKNDAYVLSVFTDPGDRAAVQRHVAESETFAVVRTGLLIADVQVLGSVLQNARKE